MKSVVMVGMFPPPVHGMAVVNSFMERELRRRGSRVIVIDLSPGALLARGRHLVGKAQRVVVGLGKLLGHGARGHVGVLYVGLSGGKGQLYELLFVLLARLFGIGIVLHHHSFAYVDRASQITRLLLALAGRKALHVFLCDRMRSGLEATYRRSLSTMVLSNCAFISFEHIDRASARSACTTIGFLSNISVAKGIMLFLDLAASVNADGLALKFIVAGPFDSPAVERAVAARIQEIGSVEYLGAVYAADKQAFFDAIDVLIFPSQYVHEAEPVTVIEALAKGIPIVATGRGCVPTLVPLGCGLVVSEGMDFVESARHQLRTWVDKPQEYRKAALAAVRRAQSCQEAGGRALSELCTMLAGACSP